MKLFGFLVTLMIFQSCDPYGFGFKKNPAYVINEAYEAIVGLEKDRFENILGREALCLYGNPSGISYLRSNLRIDAEEVEIKPQLIPGTTIYTQVPQFVGYWSYFQERYLVEIIDKYTRNDILKIVVECHYGFEGAKKNSYAKPKLKKKYKMKECKAIKVLPYKFKALPMRSECLPLKVDYDH